MAVKRYLKLRQHFKRQMRRALCPSCIFTGFPLPQFKASSLSMKFSGSPFYSLGKMSIKFHNNFLLFLFRIEFHSPPTRNGFVKGFHAVLAAIVTAI